MNSPGDCATVEDRFAQVDDSGYLVNDLECDHCGYNLRGLMRDSGKCPECGMSVRETMKNLIPSLAIPVWRQRMAKQIGWWFPCFSLLIVAMLLANGDQSYRRLPGWQDWFQWASVVVVAAGLAVIVWRFTFLSPYAREISTLMDLSRWPLRVLACIRPGLYVFVAMFVIGYSPGSSPKFIVVYRSYFESLVGHLNDPAWIALIWLEIVSVVFYLLFIKPICFRRAFRLRSCWWFSLFGIYSFSDRLAAGELVVVE